MQRLMQDTLIPATPFSLAIEARGCGRAPELGTHRSQLARGDRSGNARILQIRRAVTGDD
jgi:hypothetical protein